MKNLKSKRSKAAKKKTSNLGQKLEESLKEALKFERGEISLKTHLVQVEATDAAKFLKRAKKAFKKHKHTVDKLK